MTITRYTLFVTLCTGIISLAQLIAILTSYRPLDEAPPTQVLWLFFISVFVFMVSVLTPIWYVVKRYITSRRASVPVLVCLRQVSLLCGIIVLSMFFSSVQVLSIWDLVPLCISALLIEFFFQAEHVKPVSPKSGN